MLLIMLWIILGFASGASNSFGHNSAGEVTLCNVEFYSSAGKTTYNRKNIRENNVDFHFNE